MSIGDGEADEEISDGRDRKIDQNFHQGIDLIFLAYRAELKESEARVHGQHHDAAEQNEQYVLTGFERVHASSWE